MNPAPPVIRNVFTSSFTLVHGAEGNQWCSVAAVEQQIECRQLRNESAVQLRVDRVHVLLPLDTDAVAFEQRDIEVAPRSVSAHVPGRAQAAADVDQPLASIAADVQARRALDS